MAVLIKPLSELQIKNAKPKDKDYKLSDGGGLFLLVTTKNNKWWRLKYKILGKEKLISLGVYPEVSLGTAREKRDEFKKLIKENIDPSVVKKQSLNNSKNLTCKVANEWFEQNRERFSENYQKNVSIRLSKHILPYFGDMPISTITEEHIINFGKKIEKQGLLVTLEKVLETLGVILRYALSMRYITHNPTSNIDKGVVFKKAPVKNYPKITDEKKLGQLLNDLDNYHGSATIRHALQLLPHLFVRPGNLQHAEWSEFDIDKKIWKIPALKMKMSKPHIVPLSRQAIEIIKSLQGDNWR